MLNYDISCNIGFVADQFNQQVYKTVSEAKSEIEAFTQNKINPIVSQALTEHYDEFTHLHNPVNICELTDSE